MTDLIDEEQTISVTVDIIHKMPKESPCAALTSLDAEQAFDFWGVNCDFFIKH